MGAKEGVLPGITSTIKLVASTIRGALSSPGSSSSCFQILMVCKGKLVFLSHETPIPWENGHITTNSCTSWRNWLVPPISVVFSQKILPQPQGGTLSPPCGGCQVQDVVGFQKAISCFFQQETGMEAEWPALEQYSPFSWGNRWLVPSLYYLSQSCCDCWESSDS